MTIDFKNINGDPGLLLIDRANLELRRGRAIELRANDNRYVVAAAEILQQTLLERLRATGRRPRLVLTPQRAAALSVPHDEPDAVAVVPVAEQWSAADLRALAGAATPVPEITANSDRPRAAEAAVMEYALRFMKSGRQLPALIWIEHDASEDDSILSLDINAIVAEAAFISKHRLRKVSEARVPLSEAVDSRIAVFRDEYTLSEHIAVIVGDPNSNAAVPVRLHSACLTGDLLGSLRCDCGEQLRTAVARIAELGSGILLYLDQEGRGIGLPNKLRAYELQDTGLDTLDADQHLGFLADERTYRVAAIMLGELGVEHVQLLTNNPLKIQALRDHDIDVTGRLPLIATTTEHNERYLRAKRERAGHLAEESGS
jgi:GTP cyclohydrolase II